MNSGNYTGGSLSEMWAKNLPGLSPALMFTLLVGVGFLLPIVIPGPDSMTAGMALGSGGLVAGLFESSTLGPKDSVGGLT